VRSKLIFYHYVVDEYQFALFYYEGLWSL